MRAMVFERPGKMLKLEQLPTPEPGPGEILLRVGACGVCRTDLHILDGELPEAKLPLVPGHQIVGRVAALGPGVGQFKIGDRVGVPWLAKTCQQCEYCRQGQENLCDQAQFTGYHRDGGFADYAVADQQFCFSLPEGSAGDRSSRLADPDARVAPLLCAGLIGYRSYVLAGEAEHLGLYGFGSAAHILIQAAVFQGRKVYAFTRPGDTDGQEFARRLGAVWSGDSLQLPPRPLDAAIIFAPVGSLVPQALQAVRKGGVVVCGGIHMSDIPSFPYRYLWEERVLRSVANLTRRDGVEFLKLAFEVPVHTQVTTFALEEANEALEAIRRGKIAGSAVLKITGSGSGENDQ